MSVIVFDFYHASFEHKAYAGVMSTNIDYRAATVSDAAEAARRFYAGRQKVFPERFGELLAVKIYPRTIGEIDANGDLMTRLGMQLFEWKIDMGWTYEERIARAKQWEERSRRPGVI